MEEIFIDDKICVKCGACVTEAEFGGVNFKDGKIFIDKFKPENWEEIISICPTGALKIVREDKKNNRIDAVILECRMKN